MRQSAERIHRLARMTAAGIVQIGQHLTEVKEQLGRGQFLQWIEREFAWSEPSAERFMRMFRNVKSVNLTSTMSLSPVASARRGKDTGWNSLLRKRSAGG